MGLVFVCGVERFSSSQLLPNAKYSGVALSATPEFFYIELRL